MRSLKNTHVDTVVTDLQDRTNVAGMVKPRGILPLSARLISQGLERLFCAAGRCRAAAIGAPASLHAARSHGGFMRWHLGHRYLVSCFACSV